jgi:thiamine monophosphate synthase
MKNVMRIGPVDLVDKVAISGSFHSWEEIRANRFPYTYVFISPVYDSISKAGYKAAIDSKWSESA